MAPMAVRTRKRLAEAAGRLAVRPRVAPADAEPSPRLPVPLLLGLRLAARRPRRTLLNVASITVTASGIVAVLCVHAGYGQSLYASSGLANPQTGKLNRVLLVLTVRPQGLFKSSTPLRTV